MLFFAMGCFPLSLVVFGLGWFVEPARLGMAFLALSSFAVSHFLWYFRSLGTALGDKLGTGVYPVWWHYMLAAVLPAMLLIVVRAVLEKRGKRKPFDEVIDSPEI